ncbi:hypothetical protein C8Q79DRAFT_1012704 [Trametes meyenii]|nr:hypothetical protein C8Q79DRAFT_1012704 [Trametes meyenii]
MADPNHGRPGSPPSLSSSSLEEMLAVRNDLIKQKVDLERRILDMDIRLNSWAPINQLPNELLVQIFRNVQQLAVKEELYEHNKTIVAWYPLLGVCRAWHSLACGTPILWRRFGVCVCMHIDLFRLFLERSGTASLNVSFVAVRSIMPFLEKLKQPLSRLHTISFTILAPSQAKPLSRFLRRNNVPMLERLEVTFGRYDSTETVFAWFEGDDDSDESDEDEDDHKDYLEDGDSLFFFAPQEGQFPHLKEIILRNIALAPLPFMASSLLILDLTNCLTNLCPLVRFLRFLAGCRSLLHLRLQRYNFPESNDRELRRISLSPTLITLSIGDIATYAARLLNLLDVPATATVTVTKLPYYGIVDDRLGECLPEDRTGLPLLRRLTSLEVDYHDFEGAYSFHAWAGPERFSLTDALGATPDILEVLLEVFGDSPLLDIKLIDCHGNQILSADSDDWSCTLDLFRTLKRLVVLSHDTWSGPQTGRALFKALRLVQESGPTLLCPDLQELAITVPPDCDDVALASMVATFKTRALFGHRLHRIRLGICEVDSVRKAHHPGVFAPRNEWYINALSSFVDVVECGCDCDWLRMHHGRFWDQAIEVVTV